jgi:hypothetical protein
MPVPKTGVSPSRSQMRCAGLIRSTEASLSMPAVPHGRALSSHENKPDRARGERRFSAGEWRPGAGLGCSTLGPDVGRASGGTNCVT